MDEKNLDSEVEDKDAKRIRDKNYVNVYSNFAQIGLTPWDVRVTFSQVGEHEVDKTGVMDLATVIMTPLMAKVLAHVLRENVLSYEKQHGQIVVPPSLIRKASETESPAEADQSKAATTEAKPQE